MSNPNLRHAVIDGVLLVTPTREQVYALKAGDLAPDCFGRWAEVTRVYAQQDDVKGKAFVCYYVRFGGPDGTSEISHSMTECEPTPTVPAGGKWRRTEEYPCF